jgi:pimeloyl-ACP methyl ester carboxylesterase
VFISIRGKKVWFSDSGSGNSVVLLHGYLESSEVWNGFGSELSKSFRVISVDLPGHGLSEVYGETHSMEMMAEVVKDILDFLEIKKTIIAGHSLGGYVTLAFLEFYPERLKGYCLFHSHPLPDSPEAIEKRKREISIVEAGRKDLMYPGNIEKMFAPVNLEKMAEYLLKSKDIASRIPGEGIIAVLNGMMTRSSRVSTMEEGRVSCLWILGSMDSYIQTGVVLPKVKLPSNAKVIILENSGHLGFIEEKELSLKIVKDFADSLV